MNIKHRHIFSLIMSVIWIIVDYSTSDTNVTTSLGLINLLFAVAMSSIIYYALVRGVVELLNYIGWLD